MRQILVTGGFGFLGSHLVELLLSDPENHVHVVDSFVSSPLPVEYLLEELGFPADRDHERLSWMQETVADYLRRGVSHRVFDEIYHLASVVGPAGVIPHAGRIARSMINDAMGLAELALCQGARLLDVSTSEVYGGGVNGLCSEEMSKVVPAKVSPRLEYAVGKLAAETSLLNLHQAAGLDVRIVRPFNITGPRQCGKGGFVLPRFVGQALAGVPLTVFGDGSQLRAFTHVKDMSEGIVLAMRSNEISGQAINLGNPDNKCPIVQLANEVREACGSASPILHCDPKYIWGPLYEEANEKFPNWGKAKEIGWLPTHNRTETIADVVAYMKGLPEHLRLRLRGF